MKFTISIPIKSHWLNFLKFNNFIKIINNKKKPLNKLDSKFKETKH